MPKNKCERYRQHDDLSLIWLRQKTHFRLSLALAIQWQLLRERPSGTLTCCRIVALCPSTRRCCCCCDASWFKAVMLASSIAAFPPAPPSGPMLGPKSLPRKPLAKPASLRSPQCVATQLRPCDKGHFNREVQLPGCTFTMFLSPSLVFLDKALQRASLPSPTMLAL